MRSSGRLLFMVGLALGLLSLSAWAGGGWHKVGDFSAGGADKEVAVKRTCEVCLIKATEGEVVIRKVAMKADGKAQPVSGEQRLRAKEDRKIELGGKRLVESLVISDGGSGKYEVYVR